MEYTLEQQILHKWSTSQTFRPLHWFSVILFGFVASSAFYDQTVMWAGFVVFFAVTALPRVYKILIFAIITTIITYLFPPLGVILTVIFFFLKLSYIARNWKALLCGLIVYAYPVIVSIFLWDYDGVRYELWSMLATSCIASIIFHFLLIWLYNSKFSTKDALAVMGAAPIFFVMLILPFMNQNISDVVGYHDFDKYADSFNQTSVNPNIQVVSGYWRDGSYVDSYIRTEPDGVETNNLSYKR